jgi:putative membrane protein
MLDAFAAVLADWSLPVYLTVSIALTGLIYVRGWFAIRKTRRNQFSTARLLSFLAGLAILWLAIGSPMDGLADALLSAHMIEHLLLMSVVPPLLLCGLPVVPLLRGLPKVCRRFLVGPLVRTRNLRKFGHWLVKPIVAWLAMNFTFLAWHLPRAYDFALEHEVWHDVEHLCFLGTSILFWWVILRPWPASEHRQSWWVLLYLIAADVVNTLLSAFLAFCGRPVYRFYLDNPNPFHVRPLEDQVLGAVIMWVIGSLAFLIPAMWISVRLLQPAGLDGGLAVETL